MNAKNKSVDNIVCQNRKASFNYFFEEIFESGIELLGPEVKSLRLGKANISQNLMRSIKRVRFFYLILTYLNTLNRVTTIMIQKD